MNQHTNGQETLFEQGKGNPIPSNGKVDMNNVIQKEDGTVILGRSLEYYEHLRVTKEKDIPHPKPTITIDGAAIAAPCNITGTSAPVKAGKTAIAGAFIAGALSKTGNPDGFPAIRCIPANGRAIVGLDTEQSEADHQDNVNTILQRAKLDHTPDNLRLYNIRQLPLDEFKSSTDDICRLCCDRFGGIHMIVIDGGADYIANTNDKDQSTLIIQYFTHLSIRFTCPVIIIVHLNPGTTKEQGHFGSELQRKCYGLLTIEKEKGGDISVLAPKAFRKAGNGDISPVHFKYDKLKNYHVQIDAPDNEADKAEAEMERVRQIAVKVFAGQKSYSHGNAIKEIMKVSKKKERTARYMLQDMAGWDFIIKAEDKNYRLNDTTAKYGKIRQ